MEMSPDKDQKRKEPPNFEMSRDKDRKRREPTHMKMSRDNGQKRIVYKDPIAVPKSFFTFQSQKKTSHFFQLPVFYLVHPGLTTLLLPWTS